MAKTSVKYQTVYSELSRMADQATDGTKLPSIKELCRLFSVSLATLNSALELLAQDGRIRREPKRGIYFVHQGQPERHWKVALVLPGNQEPLFVTIITTLHRFFREWNAELSLRLYELSPESEAAELTRLCDPAECDGVLYLPLSPLFDTPQSLEVLRTLVEVKPVVQFDRQLGTDLTPFVGYECYEASYAATRYLIDQGHRDIGLIRASNDNEAMPSERLAGFFDAMRDNGLTINPRHTIVYDVCTPDLSNDVVEILSSSQCPSAFYAVNSVYMPRLMRKVNFVGKRIPDDISVICCDLSDTLANLPIAVTHFSQPTREVVTKAAEILFTQLRGEVPEEREVRMHNQLVIGESCRTICELQAQGMN